MATQSMEISEDALKLMVAENGVRGTARMLGMDERQTDAFRQRVTRGKWLADPAIAAIRAKSSPTVPYSPVVAKVSPAQAVQAELQALGAQTRTHLAKAVNAAGAHLATLPGAAIVADANNVKAVAQTADLIHGWKDQAPQVKIRLDLLSSQSDTPAIEIESSVSDSTAWDSESDPLDEY